MIARELDLRGLVPLDAVRFEVDEVDIVRAVEGPLRRALLPIEDGLGELERRLNRIESRLEVQGVPRSARDIGARAAAPIPMSQGMTPSGGRRRSDIFLRIVDENLALRGRTLASSGVEFSKVAHRDSR